MTTKGVACSGANGTRHCHSPFWNYSQYAQYSKHWDALTAVCRGLVTDDSGNVVARGFPKFHNYSENVHTPTEDFVVYEKLDSSFILLFWYASEWQVASRRSFVSEQAQTAENMLTEMYDTSHLDKALTYCFEVIYKQNRIVVDYKDRHELVLLVAFDKHGRETLPEAAAEAAGFLVIRRFDNLVQTPQQLLEMCSDNAEGFVVRFSNGQRVKLKFDAYVEVHRIVTDLNETQIWEWFKEGLGLRDIIETKGVPDELHDWIRIQYEGLAAAHADMVQQVQSSLDDARAGAETRKDIVLNMGRNPLKGLMFSLLDGRDIHAAVCDRLKEHGVCQGSRGLPRQHGTFWVLQSSADISKASEE